ncbi:synaptotagmin-like protein 2 [Ochotona princeps]|uniref:synaptotagmin-like protein 2 n=1 Tax=Ochotona princeps TaxID=9978 RepID=UPI00271451D3|nr:synaptotagmin-like protein 2 [Ochotona princeps]
MIDLSFLTEEEQEAIMKVLQRDAALKQTEEERVRHLPEKIKDDQQLKNMSGQWFYEAKAKRHRDKIHGADLIRASMRKKRLQAAAEQSKNGTRGEKESWVNNVNKDALLPPEPAGIIEQQEEDVTPVWPSSSVGNPASIMIDVSQENTRKSAGSPAKERKNPFNGSMLPEDHLPQQIKTEQSKNGSAGLSQISKEGELSELQENLAIQDNSSQNLEISKQTLPEPEDGSQIKAPIPKARKMFYKSNDLKQDDNQSFPKQKIDLLNPRGAPRGILKRNSSSSSTDSEILRLNHSTEPKSKLVSPGLTIHERISEKERCLDEDSSPSSLEPLKHVRFSAVKNELPQGPQLSHGLEVGEFSVLESDMLKNEEDTTGDVDESQKDLKTSPHRDPWPIPQSPSSSCAPENETQSPVTSGSFPNSGLNSDTEVLTTGPQSSENSPTINEHESKSSELRKFDSELPKNPADELSQGVEPEPSQVPDCSSRDHQQGKPPLLTTINAETPSYAGPYATETRTTADDSISKVLDWFNRSSPDDHKSSLPHSQGKEPKLKTDSGSQIAVSLMTDDTGINENDSEALSSTEIGLKPMKSDSAFQTERETPLSGNCCDIYVNSKSKSMNFPQQGTPKETLGILQPSEISVISNQECKNMDCSQDSESVEDDNGAFPPTCNSFSVYKESSTEAQIPPSDENVGSMAEHPNHFVHEQNKQNEEMNFDSPIVVKEPRLKDGMKAERENKEESSTLTLKTSLEPENTELLPEAANDGLSWKKPEVQPPKEAGDGPQNQVIRERYGKVSERISFWEGEKAAAKLTHKESTSSFIQEQPSTKAAQAVKPQGVFMDSLPISRSENDKFTARKVILDEDEEAFNFPSFHPSYKPKDTRSQGSILFKKHPVVDHSDKVSLFQSKINEPIQGLPLEESLHSGRSVTSVLQHPSNDGNEIRTSLEKDRSLTGESNTKFMITSLKERTDEFIAEQVYNQSQFEKLKKFWDSGGIPTQKDNGENNTITINQKNYLPFDSQQHKESNDIKSSEENKHEAAAILSTENVTAREEMEKINFKYRHQVLPDETRFPLEQPREPTLQLPEIESSKENVEMDREGCATSVLKKEMNYPDEESQESIVKASVFPKNYKDSCNDSLQRLLSEVSSPAIQPPGEEACRKQVPEPGVCLNKTWPQKADFADTEKESKEPKVTDEHIDKTVAPTKLRQNTLTSTLDKLLQEAMSTTLSPLETNLEPVTTCINSELGEDRCFEKGIEQSPSVSSHQREMISPAPEENETSENTAFILKTESGEWPLSQETLHQTAAEVSHPLDQPSDLHRMGSFRDVDNSPQEIPSSWVAYLAPQNTTLPCQREVSETIEKVVLPPKSASNNVNAVLERLHRESCPSYPAKKKDPGIVKAEYFAGVQAPGLPPNSQEIIPWCATMDTTVPEKEAFYFLTATPDKTNGVRSPLATQMQLSEQTLSSYGSTDTHHTKELPQEVAEIVRETIIQPRSEFPEFSTGLEKLLQETINNIPSNFQNDTETFFSSEFTNSTEAPKPPTPELHLEEIKETVEKDEAPTVMESAFDAGFDKLLTEISEIPSDQLQVSGMEDAPNEELSQTEQVRSLRTDPHLRQAATEASGMKTNSDDLESQVNQGGKELRGEEAVTDLLIDLCDSKRGGEIPRIPQLYLDHEIGTLTTIKPREDRDFKSEVPGAGQEPGFEEDHEAIRPSVLLTMKENPTKLNRTELILASADERQEEEKEGFSDSDFSYANTGSSAESCRNTSSSEEEPSPVLKTLERSAARKMPSKNLEDISSDSSNQGKVDNLPEELVRSADDDQKADQEPDTNECIPGISTVSSQPDNQFSQPDKIKRMSKSVPAFLQDESDDRETDTASESSYQLSRHQKSPSSLTNLSSSSGMTSLSSVSGSVISVYSGDFGNLEVKGKIQFAVDYVESLKELHVFVAQCKDLAAADVKRQRSDPYVKAYLLPDRGKMGKKKTLVVKKTLNPVYNEILRYKIEKHVLKTQKLNLSVWHRDTFKRNSFLGEVELDLDTWDWDNKQNKQLQWYPLKRKTAPVAIEAENRGEMKLALQYVPEPTPGKKLPTTGEVHIWVKECLDLPLLRGNHLNSFVKCTILPDTSRKSRQKTRAVAKTTNPVFNHTMVYDGFRPEDLTEACVELTVWDHYKLTNQFLGGLRIGFGTGKSYGTEVDWMDSTSEEVALWEKMVNSPNTWIEATLPLRMLLIAKISK